MAELDITGQRFGRLVAIKKDVDKIKEHPKTNYWQCQCDCGNIVSVKKYDLIHSTRSCGCEKGNLIRQAKEKHGMSRTPLYRVWKAMRQRCLNERHQAYRNYGGRGIGICKEWLEDFEPFRAWAMSSGYKTGLSIERVNNNEGYSPSNCKWATCEEQQNNRRSVVNVTYNGETKSIARWARQVGISEAAMRSRLRSGRCLDDVMSRNDWRRRNAANVEESSKTLLRDSGRSAAASL